MTETVGATDADAVERIVDVLIAGGVAVLPTDTVYGLAALPDDGDAMARLFELKGRAATVPVAVLCATPMQALSIAGTVSSSGAILAGQHWPGPLTLVLPRSADLDWDLGEPRSTIGVRCPDHRLIQRVAERTGPIAATSANRHGEPTPSTAAAAAASLTGPVDLVVDGGEIVGSASTVVDATGPEPTVLRQGPIRIDGG
ncbi:L-threonylcarbamoyladenylate synthase [Actinospongicola halichondriae]|uniref:L-threonylcarbamoyladenylate synthase n=1 Tax=Actinospongicola halichondriae TaxID=3236844 RepID=UPI003D46E6FB